MRGAERGQEVDLGEVSLFLLALAALLLGQEVVVSIKESLRKLHFPSEQMCRSWLPR